MYVGTLTSNCDESKHLAPPSPGQGASKKRFKLKNRTSSSSRPTSPAFLSRALAAFTEPGEGLAPELELHGTTA